MNGTKRGGLPTSAQIVTASERAILAALDTTLELTMRAMVAEQPLLEQEAYHLHPEPPPPHHALGATMLILASSLREVIAGYCALLDHTYGDGEPEQED
jgi:hypothetical protein